jgi:hypothetical protein
VAAHAQSSRIVGTAGLTPAVIVETNPGIYETRRSDRIGDRFNGDGYTATVGANQTVTNS